MSQMNAYVFECSNNTFGECVEKSTFGSNLPWALQVKKGDYCALYHGGIDTLLGLWQANRNGRKNLIGAWTKRLPYQVTVDLVTPEMVEIPQASISETFLSSTTGKMDNILEGERAELFIHFVQTFRR